MSNKITGSDLEKLINEAMSETKKRQTKQQKALADIPYLILRN